MPTRRARVWRRLAYEQPWEAYLAYLCLLAAVPLLMGPPPRGILPTWLVVLWGIELAVGGGLILPALAAGWDRAERFALTLLAASSAAWTIIVLYADRLAGIPEALATGGFALACLLRYRASTRTVVLHLGRRGSREAKG